jgi:serine/threonine protein phosphatase PrpC
MNFLRRILGHTTDTLTPLDDDIVITRGESVPEDSPPAPIVEAPSPPAGTAEKKAAAQGEDQPNTATEPGVDSLGTRPLPPLETVVPRPGQRLRFGQLSDVGMVRGNNQDAMFSIVSSGSSTDDLPDFGLFIVADGMGGHQEGERASAITTRMVARHVIQEIFAAILGQRMNDPDRPSIGEILRTGIQQANESVTEEIPEGGTTVTATVILGDLAYIAHVGDSRAYLITSEGIEQITRDHSLVQRLIELDQLTPEEAAEHPQRNVLYRAIGQSENLDVDAITRRLPPRSRLMLCSDGLWNMIPEDTILSVISRHSDPQDVCDELVQLANDRGGPDNISVIFIQIPG